MPTAREVAAFLDTLLGVPGFPDYPPALNGLQLEHRGPVRAVTTAVDFSRRTIEAAVATGANMLVLHHGMFWSGPQRITGPAFERLRLLIDHDIAVYAAHLPLDAHPRVGNCALLARALDLEPSGAFHEYQGVPIGAMGTCDLPTHALVQRADAFARALGGQARSTAVADDARTRRWATITGAGADSSSLRAAAAAGIDTLIVGEGPHHTTVDAPDVGVTVIYAGHYATETLGVRALADEIGARFAIPAEFLLIPTGS